MPIRMAALRKLKMRAPTMVPMQFAASFAPMFHPTKKPAAIRMTASRSKDMGQTEEAEEAGSGSLPRSDLGRTQIIDRFRNFYLLAQGRILEHRWAFLMASVAALWFSLGLAQHVPIDLFPSDFNQLMVTLEAPADHGVDQTDGVVRGMEEALVPIRQELTDVSSYVGVSMSADQSPEIGVNLGLIFVSFPNTHANIADPDRVLNLVRERLETYRALLETCHD